MNKTEEFLNNLTAETAQEIKRALVKIMTLNMNFTYTDAAEVAENILCDKFYQCEEIPIGYKKSNFVTDCE